MGQQFNELSALHTQFIAKQKMFFVATATADGRVNLSPKGLDAFRVINNNRIAWLNLTGSGNETAAHLLEQPRMTIMFCAFQGKPIILRLYGQARALYDRDLEWSEYAKHFDLIAGTRQIFVMEIDLVQTSCGMAVPLFEFQGQRNQLVDWAQDKGRDGVEQYWKDKNQFSLDQTPTGIIKN
jgi:Pyridoxamine 5'-phosphate oxidase